MNEQPACGKIERAPECREMELGQSRSDEEYVDTALPVMPYCSLFLSNLYTTSSPFEDVGEFLRTCVSPVIQRGFRLDAGSFIRGGPSILSRISDIEPETLERLRVFLAEKTDIIDTDQRTLHAVLHMLGEDVTGRWLVLLAGKIYGKFDPSVRRHAKCVRLREDFGLDDDEIDYIAFLYCRERNEGFSRTSSIAGSINDGKRLGAIIGIPQRRLRAIIHPEGKLRRLGLATWSPEFPLSFFLELDDGLKDFLCDLSDKPYGNMTEPVGFPSWPLDSFPVDPEAAKLAAETLARPEPRHIFLYGEPGTGKTEFAKALVAASGKEGISLPARTGNDGGDSRIPALWALSRTHSGGNGSGIVVVVDECDMLLNSERRHGSGYGEHGGACKAWLNDFLETAGMSTIWITNDTEAVHPSVGRRFAFAVRFGDLSGKNRQDAWRRNALASGFPALAQDERALALVRSYRPNPADVSAALDLACSGPEADAMKRLELAFKSRNTLRTGDEGRSPLIDVTQAYDSEAIAVSIPAAELVAAAKRAVESGRNACMLFHGEPGSGKTELAKYVAATAGLDILVRRASDLLDPFVGVAEKRIAAMFAEAERNGQLLLLDEADSMLQDRRLSTRSWEVSHTNELLTQMENFRGVFVACTNFLDRLDRAALRRFAWKVRLEAMDGPRRERMFARWFPRLGLDEGARERLSRIPRLSPGDFKAVATLFEDRLEAAPEAAPEAVPELGTTLDAVLDALAEEASYRQTPEEKRRPAGFLP